MTNDPFTQEEKQLIKDVFLYMMDYMTNDPLTKVELCILQDALITYKYQSNYPKDKIRIIQKKLLKIEDSTND